MCELPVSQEQLSDISTKLKGNALRVCALSSYSEIINSIIDGDIRYRIVVVAAVSSDYLEAFADLCDTA